MTSKQVIICSGNILSKGITWKKGNETAEEELYQSLKSSIAQQQEIKDHSWDNGNAYEFVGEKEEKSNEESNEEVNRQDLKVTAKIFLYSLKRDDILAAINRGLSNTSVEHLDTLVFAISGQTEGNTLSIDMLKSTWSVLEEMVSKEKVKMIGLCDVDTQLFIQLYNWATVKPNIVQINLASCCVVPPELSEFCKLKNVQLLTHSDPINILSEEKLESLISAFRSVLVSEEKNGAKWEANWVLRYQIHLKCRGVLSTKGYVASIAEITA